MMFNALNVTVRNRWTSYPLQSPEDLMGRARVQRVEHRLSKKEDR